MLESVIKHAAKQIWSGYKELPVHCGRRREHQTPASEFAKFVLRLKNSTEVGGNQHWAKAVNGKLEMSCHIRMTECVDTFLILFLCPCASWVQSRS